MCGGKLQFSRLEAQFLQEARPSTGQEEVTNKKKRSLSEDLPVLQSYHHGLRLLMQSSRKRQRLESGANAEQSGGVMGAVEQAGANAEQLGALEAEESNAGRAALKRKADGEQGAAEAWDMGCGEACIGVPLDEIWQVQEDKAN